MFDTITLLFTEFTGGVMSVFNWKPKESLLYGPIIGLTAVLFKLLGVILGGSLIGFLLTYSSYIIVSKTYSLLF